ncbi:M1 family metallopeptidase [Nonomuraea sp. NPDC050328]|uniref:M1 family metallopeptidase n=1 Tax=Nonomuraea sp. NPDC050328 TaxID=3364361 RepID=UPI0037B65582
MRKTALLAVAALCAGTLALPAQAATPSPTPSGPSPGAPGVGDPLYPTLGNGGYDVRHYDVRFDFTPVTYDFAARVKITATATQALSRFNLDTDGNTIDSVTVNGTPAQWALTPGHTGQELTVTPAEPLHVNKPFEVEIASHGNGKNPRASVTGWVFGPDGGFASATQSSRADTFFPVNDHPSDKATWDLHVSAPEGYVATGNGELVSRTGDVWHFRVKEPMATELLGLSVAKGVYLYGTGPHALPLRHIVPQGQEAKYGPIVAETAAHLEWTEAKFGRYPFSTYGIHVYPGYGAALENQTLSLFGTGWFNSPTYANTMIHELVHQWFGNSVSPATWQEAWLNEGPAVYYAALWNQEQGRQPLKDRMRIVYDRLNPVRLKDGPPGRPKALGGFNIYDGGALVLYALRTEVGDAGFDRIMRRWVQRHKNGVASTEDFIAHAVKTTHRPELDGFLRGWLFGTENPPLNWDAAP